MHPLPVMTWLCFKTFEGEIIIMVFCCFSECPANDEICSKDKLGFEAITNLHTLIDDDQNGNLDRSESDEVCSS